MDRGYVMRRLAEEVDLFKGARVRLIHGADGERTAFWVNGVNAATLVQFYRENGEQRHRLNIGAPGRRRVFVQNGNGEFRWLEAAKALLDAITEEK